MSTDEQHLAAELERFREKLLDLTKSNPLLNYRKSSRRTVVIVDERPDQVYRRLVLDNKRFRFAPLEDGEGSVSGRAQSGSSNGARQAVLRLPQRPLLPQVVDEDDDEDGLESHHLDDKLQTEVSTARLETLLKSISRDSRTAIEEAGINYLFLAMGMLSWRESDESERELFAPLILVPVEINRYFDARSNSYEFSVRWREEEIQDNLCLVKKLERDFGKCLPRLEEEQVPEAYLRAVSHAIADRQGWYVDHSILIGFFSFQKLLMYMDIDPALWVAKKRLSGDSIVGQMVWGQRVDSCDRLYASDYYVDREEGTEQLVLATDADSSQQSALIDIARGKNLVIEGPPGTGKSQTITNAIATAIHSNKTVLFVAEKLAALEVVYAKLREMGLGEFCLQLHSDAASPRLVFDSLKKRMEATFRQPAELASLKLELERKMGLISDYLSATGKVVGPYQEPLYQAFWRVVGLRSGNGRSLPAARCAIDLLRHEFDENIENLESFAEAVREVDQPKRSAWWGYWPMRINPNDSRPIEIQLDEMREVSLESDRLLATVDSSFSRVAAQWLEPRLGQPDVADKIDFLAELAARLPSSEDLKRFVDPAVRQRAIDFVALRRELVKLEPRYRSIHFAGLDMAAESAMSLATVLKRDVLPFAPRATWNDIRRLRAKAIALLEALTRVRLLGIEMQRQGLGECRSLREYEAAELNCRLVQHEIVAEVTSVPSQMFLRSAGQLLVKARQESERLRRFEEELQEAFHLPSSPSDTELDELTKTIRTYAQSWHRFLSRNFRAARRALAGFWRPGIGKKPLEWVRHLERLRAWQYDSQALATHNECRHTFGDLFHGAHTDWEKCDTLLKWVRKAQSVGLDHGRVTRLLQLRDGDALRPADITGARKSLITELGGGVAKLIGYEIEDQLAQSPIQEIEARVSRIVHAIEAAEAATGQLQFNANEPLPCLVNGCEALQQAAHITRELNDREHWHELASWRPAGADDLSTLLEAVKFGERFNELDLLAGMDALLFTKNLADNLSKLGQCLSLARSFRERWNTARDNLTAFGRSSTEWLRWSFDDVRNGTLKAKLNTMRSEIDVLPAWAAFCRALDVCEQRGLQDFAEAVVNGLMEPADVAHCYRFTVLERITEKEVGAHPALRSFARTTIEKARQRYKELDRQLLQTNRLLVAFKASGRRGPSGNSTGRVGEYSEMGLIRHEIQKQRRHCRIRNLLLRAGAATQALMPCFMMSPLSVAQFLDPSGVEFDLVIMDEASQVKPEDAIGVLLRAKQIVVVGDPKQLPPTSFFDRLNDEADEQDATQFDNTESILEVAMKAYQPVRRLRWHYRSRHESLIHFSNNRFYDGDLVIFPSSQGSTADLGVRHHFVADGIFENGANTQEAEVVAKAIITHAQRNPHESLGVGAFNLKQSVMIQDLVDRHCQADPSAREAVDRLNERHEGLFVKNLENLQGDERDVIFISYTYGRDRESGKVMNRFGPISGEAGWRRLNVLITRARMRVEVFSSMTPNDILGGPDKSLGVNALRDYLEFCQSGHLPDRGEASGREMDSPFEEAVARVVRAMGVEAIPQVGVAGYFIDLGVRRPGSTDFVLGIECDGATYHSSKSARDRDRLREEVIRSRGWRLHRIWSTDWYLNQRHEEERLRQAITNALDTPFF